MMQVGGSAIVGFFYRPVLDMSRMPIRFSRASKLLFIGDSITDCGRRTDPEGLGSGYPGIIRDWLASRDPANAPIVINVGISGNKIPDLVGRWDRDVLANSPDVVSVKIGINDVWHGLDDPKNGCLVQDYTAGYSQILEKLKSKLPACQIVLCEPSVIDPPQPARANEALQPYVRAVHELAKRFEAACVVPLHRAFVDACNARKELAWTTDGVHPTQLGHTLIARTWLASTGLL